VLHSERFLDWSPAAVWAALLDEGRYLCSERTMPRRPPKLPHLWPPKIPHH
jgi:hypothetical protein